MEHSIHPPLLLYKYTIYILNAPGITIYNFIGRFPWQIKRILYKIMAHSNGGIVE